MNKKYPIYWSIDTYSSLSGVSLAFWSIDEIWFEKYVGVYEGPYLEKLLRLVSFWIQVFKNREINCR